MQWKETGRLTLLGKPVGKARHRKGRWGNYDPQSAEKKTTSALMAAKWQHGILDGPLRVDIIASFVRPKSSRRAQPTVKPDSDNISKFFLDCGNGIIWSDDKNIVELYVCKRYADAEQTEIIVSEACVNSTTTSKLDC